MYIDNHSLHLDIERNDEGKVKTQLWWGLQLFSCELHACLFPSPKVVMTLFVSVSLELAWIDQNAIMLCHCLPPPPDWRQEARLWMTLAFLIVLMLPRPWSLRRQWEGASKQRWCSFECVSTLMHVVSCRAPISKRKALLPHLPQIQHSIDRSLQLTARLVPNQFLAHPPFCSTICPSLSLHSSSLHFSHHPLVSPIAPPHAPTSHPKVSGVTPTKVIRKQQLEEKSILYQHAMRGFCTYPLWSLW